jgi:acetyl-CoA carboxylase biotin carboxyl carrier protein
VEEIKDIAKALMVIMRQEGCERLVVKDGDFEIEIERGSVVCSVPSAPPQVTPEHGYPLPQKKEEGKFITSPVVGTFYDSLDGKSPACINVGDSVESETIVGMVEAMKVMNEVTSGKKGVVVEVLVESGSPVEYGTKIYRLN